MIDRSVGAAVVLLALLLGAPIAVLVGAVSAPVGAAVVVGTLALTGLGALYRAGGGTVWNAIPGDQYAGRHAESGGIARGEQERAIEEVQRQADDPDDRR